MFLKITFPNFFCITPSTFLQWQVTDQLTVIDFTSRLVLVLLIHCLGTVQHSTTTVVRITPTKHQRCPRCLHWCLVKRRLHQEVLMLDALGAAPRRLTSSLHCSRCTSCTRRVTIRSVNQSALWFWIHRALFVRSSVADWHPRSRYRNVYQRVQHQLILISLSHGDFSVQAKINYILLI